MVFLFIIVFNIFLMISVFTMLPRIITMNKKKHRKWLIDNVDKLKPSDFMGNVLIDDPGEWIDLNLNHWKTSSDSPYQVFIITKGEMGDMNEMNEFDYPSLFYDGRCVVSGFEYTKFHRLAFPRMQKVKMKMKMKRTQWSKAIQL